MSFIVTAVTAVEGAIAVTTVASVATAVAAVGTAMTVVGAVTGNKGLMKVGGVLGLVGGVGSLANSALTSMAGEGAAGVAEGAAEGAYSDVAGEKFAQEAGQDAAGSMFGDAATQTSAVDLGGAAANAAGDSGGSGGIIGNVLNAPPAQSLTPGVSQATDILGDSSQAATPYKLPDLSPKLPTPTGAPDLSGTDLATDANGMYTGQPTALADSAMPSAAPLKDITRLSQTYGLPDQSTLDKIISKAGSMWNGMSPQEKAEFVKAGLAIPGGIQSQNNKSRELDLTQQRINQSSYGNQVPTFGIIGKAQKG